MQRIPPADSAVAPGGRARLRGRVERLLAHPRTPLWLLGVVSLLSLGSRLVYLERPTDSTGTHNLIFDEKYYVNAARVILSLPVPADGAYRGSPAGVDPNTEHPGLAKLGIAGTMKLFGDNPLGWRILPVIFGSLAILLMYRLVRAGGGSSWLALGAATLMSVDNLSMVHGRIATLDIFVLVFMLAAIIAYLEDHPLVSGLLLGIGCATKLVGLDAILIVVVFEAGVLLLRRAGGIRVVARAAASRAVPVLTCAAAALMAYLGVLYAVDSVVTPPHDPNDAHCAFAGTRFRNPIVHTRFMLCYADQLKSLDGPQGIASYPWQWFLNEEPINYYTVNTNVYSNGQVTATHPVIQFQGLMNPGVIFFAIPALALLLHTAWRDRDNLSIMGVAWFVATWGPFAVYGDPWPFTDGGHRTSYLYYMVIVLPAIYIALARLFSRRFLPRAAMLGYTVILGYGFWSLYPFRTWPAFLPWPWN